MLSFLGTVAAIGIVVPIMLVLALAVISKN